MQKMPLLSGVGPMQSSGSPGQVTEFLSCWNLKDLNVHPAPPRTHWSKRCSFCVRGAERKQIQAPLTHRFAQNAPARAYASANANTWLNQATSVLWYLDVQHRRDPTHTLQSYRRVPGPSFSISRGNTNLQPSPGSLSSSRGHCCAALPRAWDGESRTHQLSVFLAQRC